MDEIEQTISYEHSLAYQRMAARLERREHKHRQQMPIHGRSVRTLVDTIRKKANQRT